ncbi:MAG: hypothetical protein A3J28_01485 [Acidobacteria bacterium RIFCSPLOWO2_12_FULL_60_22]|nr:MAG: hypothetical protein A3J28_01485 [Acidobacteria bacterium RIFCSPLOWO2_12_FULL_60_22]
MPLERRTKQANLPFPRDGMLGIARRQLDQFVSLESKVLKGDNPEAIHDIRVASRRLQQLLDLLYPAPPPPKVRKLRRTIRRSRRVLSEIRNCDVLLDRVERVLARKQTARREVWEAFQDYLREQRERSFLKASRRLSRLHLPALYLRLKEHLRSPSKLPSHPDLPASETAAAVGDDNELFRSRVDKALQETWSSLETCIGEAQEKRSAAALHAVRIAAKKVRYLMEAIHELDVSGSDQALTCLRHLQRHLGDWHDLEVLEQMMLEMVARPEFLQERLQLAMEVERLVLRNRRNKKSYEEKFYQMTRNSEEWQQLTDWVQNFLSTSSAHSRRGGKEDHSPGFPPART